MTSGVAVIIVTHNSQSVIGPCLSAATGCGEIVVVDNASSDHTCRIVEYAPAARLIRNTDNRGFAAAANQGIRDTQRPLLLLLNPDAILKTTIEPLVEECLQPGVGAAAGRLVDIHGRDQTGFNVRRFPTPTALAFELLGLNGLWPGNPVNRRYRCLDFDSRQAQDIEQPAGAFLMVRRDVWEEIGGFDEQFVPLWFEDVDLCLRMRQAGHTIRFVPSCIAEHAGAHSIPAMTVQQRHAAWYGNLLRFSYKHFSKSSYRWLHATVLIGLACRWLRCLLRADAGQERKAYRKVFKRFADAGSCRDRNAAIQLGSTSPS